MSRRQHTTLILQVRIPVPAGKTQAQTLEWVKESLTVVTEVNLENLQLDPFISSATQIKITGRETVYL